MVSVTPGGWGIAAVADAAAVALGEGDDLRLAEQPGCAAEGQVRTLSAVHGGDTTTLGTQPSPRFRGTPL